MTMPAQPQPPAPPQAPAPGTITIPAEPPTGAFDPRTGDPAQPAPANDPNGVWGAGVQPAQPPAPTVQPVPQPTPVPAPVAAPGVGTPIQPVTVDGQQYFTVEALEEARRQEREKLYGRMEEQGQQLRSVTEFVEQEKQRREQAEREAAEAAERERQAGLTIDQRLEEMQRTFSDQLRQRDEQLAMQQAVMDRENQLREVGEYRARRVAEEQDLIHPALLANISGTTNEEIEQSITAAKAQTDAIVQDMQGQQVAQRQQMRTVAPTGAPPVGPSDNASGQQTYTAEDIQRMDPATYAKNRGALLQAVSARAAQGALYQP